MGAHADFWQVTGEALDHALETFGIEDDELREDLMRAYLTLECYPEVKDVLTALKDKRMKVAVLSNGTRGMIEAATAAAGISKLIDGIYTVDEVGIYKPHPRFYRLACERLDLPAGEISFQSANAWDAVGAAYFGLKVVWINRSGQKAERLPRGADAVLDSLVGLPELLGY
jgi:2-haloacid dehalogenase